MRRTHTALVALAVLLVILFPADARAQSADSIRALLKRAGQGTAHVTRIESLDGDLAKLQNGAVLEMQGYMSYASYGTAAILFRPGGRGCELHVRGRSGRCAIVRPPQGTGLECQKTSISEVRASGKMIRLVDGSLYEVPYQSFMTSLWAYNDALLCGLTLFNLSTGDEVSIQPL